MEFSSSVTSKLEKLSMVLRFIYILFLGIFLATFVGVGIAAFYSGPTFPDQPILLKYCSPEITKDATKYSEFQKQAQVFEKAVASYGKIYKLYNRNVSIASLVAAIILVITSLTFFRKILLIADGILLGGVLTLIYSVIRGFGADDNIFRFFVVSVGLFVSLVLGYMKFIRLDIKTNKI